MRVSYKDDTIIFHIDSGSNEASLERSYLKRFDGATVGFISSVEGDKLVINNAQQTI